MAKRLIKWVIDGAILKVGKYTDEKESALIIEAEFDLSKIFPAFNELTDVQRQMVVFGAKQKLSDSGAENRGDSASKILSAKEVYDQWLAGKWVGERTNATGAATNKKLADEVKAMSKVVTLEGLLMKKALSKIAGQEPFTEDDQNKLNEFMGIVASAKNGNKK